MFLIGWKSGARIFSLSQSEAMQYQGVYEIGFLQSIHFSPSKTLWVGYLNEV